MSGTASHRRHRRPARRAGARGAVRWRLVALILPLALLVAGVGFGLEQVVLAPSAASADGASTVSARPDVGTITAAAPDSARAPTSPSAGATGPIGVKNAGGLSAITVPTVPLTSTVPSAPGGGSTAPAAAPRSVPAQRPAAAGAPAAGAASGSPFTSAALYVDPNGDAAKAVRALGTSGDAAGAQTLQRLAGRSHADWFGDPVPATVRTRVADRVRVVRAAGALPVLVAYAIPQRDCGGQSAGGIADEAGYRAWIAAFAAGIGAGPAAVILEPDALAQVDCLSPAAASARYAMLGFAVDQLSAVGADVYLDAGNATWHPAADTAARLRLAGVDRARGFALNVANFDETADETAYGDAVVAALGGGAHFVVDTSRNGRGPAAGNVWCNPPDRGLGIAPTGQTGDPRADAYLWIKVPGESDGACNGGPAAGQWWLDYARGLASRAA